MVWGKKKFILLLLHPLHMPHLVWHPQFPQQNCIPPSFRLPHSIWIHCKLYMKYMEEWISPNSVNCKCCSSLLADNVLINIIYIYHLLYSACSNSPDLPLDKNFRIAMEEDQLRWNHEPFCRTRTIKECKPGSG